MPDVGKYHAQLVPDERHAGRSSAAGDRGQQGELDPFADLSVLVVEIAGVVRADEHVDVGAQRSGFVTHPATDSRMGVADGVEHGSHRDRWRNVELELGGATRVLAQRRRQADDDPQLRTAVLTQSTGGR